MTANLVRRSVAAMRGYVPGEQPKDPGIIKLNTNENPYPPAPGVARVLGGFGPDLLRLYPDPVCGRLRERLAAMHGVRPEQVFVGNGSDEVLALCARAFVEHDGTGTIGWFDPSYSLYPVLAEIEQVPTKPIPLGPAFDWNMPEGYAASLFFLTHPNAPTGMLYPEADIRRFCERFPGVVLADEAYVDFADRDLVDLARTLPNVLVARTLSKSYSLAGLRLGYAVGPEPLIAALFTIKDSYNVSRLTQELALAALEDPAHMRANRDRIVATRARASAALAALGFEVSPSASNFLWARPPSRMPAEAMFRALRERRVFVRHFPGGRTGGHLRISIGTDAEMDALLAAVAEMLNAGGTK